MKIQLTTDQLNRLIGDDKEFEIQLKKCVVHEFSKTYLKTIVDDESISELRKELVAYIKNGIDLEGKQILDVDSVIRSYSYTITYKIKKMLESSIEESIEKTIESNKYWVERKLDDKIKKALDSEIEKRITEGVNERLRKALEG